MKLVTEGITDGVVLIRVGGRLDLVTAPELSRLISATLERHQVCIVLDLKGVSFIDSSGLRSLIAGLKAARMAGGDLRLAAPTAAVALVLKNSTLDRILRSYATAESAFPAKVGKLPSNGRGLRAPHHSDAGSAQQTERGSLTWP
ncbi:MAG: STAS domain-containing protein [Microbacteriaceae bacterium]|nr:STAS domain-containing protein [Microbacteriaceae bacterium]